MDEFFKTRMGARFYEHTMPEIATQLKRIADALEACNLATTAASKMDQRQAIPVIK